MATTKAEVWKWVAGSLSAIMVSNLLTAIVFGMMFRVTDGHIKDVVKDSFTDISNGAGMYALEGRPKLRAVEKNQEQMAGDMRDVRDRITRMETKLDRILEKQ